MNSQDVPNLIVTNLIVDQTHPRVPGEPTCLSSIPCEISKIMKLNFDCIVILVATLISVL